ncbi:MAG: AAA family ATPase [Leptospiraceae bacterium]|nr:AAA family ATPase [Leptospiraceae bacterium]
MHLPVIVVTSTTLGTINHTLLTIEALKNRKIQVLGFYMIGEKTNLLSSNLETIQKFSKTKCLGVTILPERRLKTIELEKFAQKNFDISGDLKFLL